MDHLTPQDLPLDVDGRGPDSLALGETRPEAEEESSEELTQEQHDFSFCWSAATGYPGRRMSSMSDSSSSSKEWPFSTEQQSAVGDPRPSGLWGVWPDAYALPGRFLGE